MMAPPTFWRWLSCLLALALATSLVALRLHTGYPTEWDKVQVGMTISQVRAICGTPTVSSAGMKPDHWEVPFLLGAWHLKVGHGEIEQGPQSVTNSKEIRYAFEGSQTAWVLLHNAEPPAQDWDAFDLAFGQQRK